MHEASPQSTISLFFLVFLFKAILAVIVGCDSGLDLCRGTPWHGSALQASLGAFTFQECRRLRGPVVGCFNKRN